MSAIRSTIDLTQNDIVNLPPRPKAFLPQLSKEALNDLLTPRKSDHLTVRPCEAATTTLKPEKKKGLDKQELKDLVGHPTSDRFADTIDQKPSIRINVDTTAPWQPFEDG